MQKKLSALFLGILWLPSLLLAQEDQIQIGIGEWRSHQDYSKPIKLAESGNRLYCATFNGLFYIDKRDGSARRLSKVDGLASVRIEDIAYFPEKDVLFISYDDANIDLLFNNRIRNVPNFAEAEQVFGERRINSFYFHRDIAYFATTLGIFEYDVDANLILEDYRELGPGGQKVDIRAVCILGDEIFAASEAGILRANLNDNIEDFNVWSLEQAGDAKDCIDFNGKVYASVDNELRVFDGQGWTALPNGQASQLNSFEIANDKLLLNIRRGVLEINTAGDTSLFTANSPFHSTIDQDGSRWLAFFAGLVKVAEDGKFDFIIPNGPARPEVWRMAYVNKSIWATAGAYNSIMGPSGRSPNVYRFRNNSWSSNEGLIGETLEGFKDISAVAADPNRNKIYLASYNRGVLEITDGLPGFKVWNAENSELKRVFDDPVPTVELRVSDVAVDSNGNVWMANHLATNQLVVVTTSGNSFGYNLGSEKSVRDIVIDREGKKWVSLKGAGIYVFDDQGSLNSTSPSQVKLLSSEEGRGQVPDGTITAMTMDLEGDIWIGSAEGIKVFYEPELVFGGNNFDAQQIFVRENGNDGFLLDGQAVNCIAVDGANRKWIGTNSGVWVTSPDGTETFARFTEDNSPLLSDVILDIEINQELGEVFFGTSKGIISYRGTATEGGDKHEGVYAFPNPVRPGYDGPIAVTGLVRDADVRITDISGNLVYATTAEGGQAIWDGRTLNGRKVATGVYLVFSSNQDGSDTFITKIMVVR